jgi:predicted kinase
MPTAHMIYGYIGAGKTTFARKLERDVPAIRFTHDEWMQDLYGSDPPVQSFQTYSAQVSRRIELVWHRCFELGLDVVLDLGFWSRAQRDAVREFVDSVGGSHVLYALECAEDVAWARVERRNLNLDSSLYIARNTFEIFKPRFESLGADETHVTLNTER